jgi:hypothetical protein
MNNHNNFKVGEIVSIVQPRTGTDYGLAKITKLNPSKALVVMTEAKRPSFPTGKSVRVPYGMIVKLDSQPKPANEVITVDVTKQVGNALEREMKKRGIKPIETEEEFLEHLKKMEKTRKAYEEAFGVQ